MSITGSEEIISNDRQGLGVSIIFQKGRSQSKPISSASEGASSFVSYRDSRKALNTGVVCMFNYIYCMRIIGISPASGAEFWQWVQLLYRKHAKEKED